MSVFSLASKLATKVASKVPSTPLTKYFGSKINQATLPKDLKVYAPNLPFNSSVAKSAGMTALNVLPYGRAANLAKTVAGKLPAAASLASKLAVPTANAAKTLSVPKFGSASSISTLTKSPTLDLSKKTFTAPAKTTATNLTNKTTTAKNAGKIDTSLKPTATPSTVRKLPVAKTLGAGALGLSAYSMLGGGSSQDTGTGSQQNPFATEALAQNPTMGADGTTTDTTGYDIDSAFGSSTPTANNATANSTSGFGGQTSSGSFFGSGGYSALGGSAAASAGGVSGKSARQQALEDLMAKYDESKNDGTKSSDESGVEERIAALEAMKQNLDLDLETSSASAYGREAQRGLLDRETRRSLIPLQTSLALFQAERERQEGQKDKDFERQKYLFEQMYPQEDATKYPASVQEYQFAQQQGYTGSYQDFQREMNAITSSSANTGDKILTPSEAADLGVPYGTTQSQAYGQNPTKLSGDAAKILAITETIVPEINQLKQRFSQDYRGALMGYLSGTDRELVKLVDQVADKVGRLRSGGAVNADEEERFKRQIASIMDLPFGEAQQAISALDNLINEAQQVSRSINTYSTSGQQSSGGDWSW